ncbi:MAG: long-chain fatty acid--CoA ligase, partial [Planctomycetes bacterium]|nr:long-chain fatty acid--CoA ligase [Planctomycetota bacterium]
PAVAEAAVVGLPDPVWGEEVAAFVVAKPPPSIAPLPAALATFCRERLADYKCPRRVVLVDSLPKTATGKVRKGEVVRLYGVVKG